MHGHVEPTVVVQKKRHDEGRSNGKANKRPRSDLLHEGETRVYLNGSDEATQGSPPWHPGEAVSTGQRIRKHSEHAHEERQDEREGDSICKPLVTHRLKELRIHGSAARLQRAAQDDERINPSYFHKLSLSDVGRDHAAVYAVFDIPLTAKIYIRYKPQVPVTSMLGDSLFHS
jgi:hypothetical protein